MAPQALHSYSGMVPPAGMVRPGMGGLARPGPVIKPGVSSIKPLQQTAGYGGAGATAFSAFSQPGTAAARQGVVRTATPASALSASTASVWPRGTSGGAADRSRTPTGRTATPTQPAKPPPKKKSDLPYPWEEHWSEDYQIPYFRNSETGDSLWERPTA